MAAPDDFVNVDSFEGLESGAAGEAPTRRPNRMKAWCEAGHHMVPIGAPEKMCSECAREWGRMWRLYQTILTARPHLDKLSMSQTFEAMWKAFQGKKT